METVVDPSKQMQDTFIYFILFNVLYSKITE